MPSRAKTSRRTALRLTAACLAAASLGVAGSARADRYDPEYAGHPLRIIAYVVHPLGVAVDYLILRPAHWVGSHEPFTTIFGHTEEG